MQTRGEKISQQQQQQKNTILGITKKYKRLKNSHIDWYVKKRGEHKHNRTQIENETWFCFVRSAKHTTKMPPAVA